jgi:hypothetical protein
MGKTIFTLFMCGLNIEARKNEKTKFIETFLSEN